MKSSTSVYAAPDEVVGAISFAPEPNPNQKFIMTVKIEVDEDE